MRNFLIKVAALLTLVAILCCSCFFWFFSYDPIFSESYTSSILDKYERLASIEEPKMVLVAGSNFAFGIDSRMLEEAIGMPVVNMGLQASWGMQTLLDVTKDCIKEGDIVILGFEYHLYNAPEANYELVVNTLENNIGMYKKILRYNNVFPLVASYFQYFCHNYEDITTGNKHTYSGQYSRTSFNQYGDNNFDRPQLIAEDIPARYLSVNESTISEAALDYLNEYAEFVRSQKADVYITFASTNEVVFAEDSDLDMFLHRLEERVDIPVSSDPHTYIYPCDYFFDGDGNHHLNNQAIVVRTTQLISDLFASIIK